MNGNKPQQEGGIPDLLQLIAFILMIIKLAG